MHSKNKTVLITGTSTGIGRATALHLDSLGFRVLGTVRGEEDAAALAAETSANCKPLLLDVTSQASLQQLQAALAEEAAPAGLYGLVNNAGIAFTGPLEFIPLEQLRALYDVHVFGLLAVTQICLPYLRQAHGRIINMSSSATLGCPPFHGPYSSAKAAVNALSESLRLEVRPFGIQVSVIICGSTRTPLWERGRRQSRHIRQQTPQKAETLYGEAFGQLLRYFRKLDEAAFPPQKVAETIEQALTSKRAKLTYYVGRDAQQLRLARDLVPERMRDWLKRRVIGLDG